MRLNDNSHQQIFPSFKIVFKLFFSSIITRLFYIQLSFETDELKNAKAIDIIELLNELYVPIFSSNSFTSLSFENSSSLISPFDKMKAENNSQIS